MQMPWSKEGRLLKAVKSGNVGEVQELLQSGVNPNTEDMVGRHVLGFATARNDADIVLALLKAGADPNAKSLNNLTPLMSSNSPKIVKALLEAGADPEITNNDGWSPLMIAASDGDIEIVRILLEVNTNPNTKDTNNRTALGLAVHNHHTEIVRILLKAGANPNSKSNSGTTALMMAAVDGNTEIVKLLKETGANPYIKDVNGNTAIMNAAAMGHTHIVELLNKEDTEQDSLYQNSPSITPPRRHSNMLGKITGIEKKVKWSRGKMIQVYGPPIYGDHNIFVDSSFKVAVFLPKGDKTLHVLVGDIVKANRWLKFDANGNQLFDKKLSERDHEWKINPKNILYRGNMFSPGQPVYKGEVVNFKEFNEEITDEWLFSMKNKFMKFMHES